MVSAIKVTIALKLVIVQVLIITAIGDTDPAALIPVVEITSVDSSGSNSYTLDPADYSPNTPQPSLVVGFNKTEDPDVCFDSNSTRVLVHGIDKTFCVHERPICDTENHKGVCPQTQQNLPNGSYCSPLPHNGSAYGCVERLNTTSAPTACHHRSFKT
ncbi:hypothetical protein P3T76_008486 [Phytophthora citrophthora]|uniref:Secreted protein n=1 Tax=Phytophthora citrophthora TaxID=4793 RepID=A0AAD9LKK5_9STRA|nr:hypothetical protein P3T76_008486 [Phytophthora citrophthora]